MLNPIFVPFAFMGGRSWAEMAQYDQAKAMDSSILIGIGSVISAVIIYFGQNLFWQSIPSTSAAAGSIALVLTLVYAFFYRLLIRASEVMHWSGKTVVLTLGFGLAGVNAMLAGHELVMLPFSAQVQEMTALQASQNIGTLREQSEKALGLGDLRKDSEQVRTDENAARQRLESIPAAVQALQQQATQCDNVAQRLAAQIPAEDQPNHAQAHNQWRTQAGRCAATHRSANQALAQHRAQAQQDLAAVTQRKAQADAQLQQAQSQRDTAVQNASPALQASATTGFGRHKALWAAVQAGKIPAWAAYGLMGVALILECAGLLLKLFLPPDDTAYTRKAEVGITQAMGQAEMHYIQEFSRQTQPAMRSRAAQTQQDAERLVDTVLAPGMIARLGAEQFARAARATRAAQQRSGQAATPVIDMLSKVMPWSWRANRGTSRRPDEGMGYV